jgi:hypothetical protein
VSPLLPRFVYRWPAYWQELYLERAAIMEFEGGMTREQAQKKPKRIFAGGPRTTSGLSSRRI